MKLKVKYISIDPYETTHEQTFIGIDINDCDNQRYEYEKYLGRYHSNGISSIFKTEIIFDGANPFLYNGT